MASHFNLVLTFLLVILFISPSTSLTTCSSQTFSTKNTHFTNCTDLPSLKSFLHWTYDSSKSTLSIAFIASPASPGGWIAWGINPTTPAMVGTQCLVALESPNGSVIVKTYNLTSYKSITESKLSYKLLDSKAESSDGVIRIFATLVLPENTTMVNQVWQVGPAVKDGMPMVHKFDPDNLKSKGTLDLSTSTSSAAAGDGNKNATAPASSTGSGGGGGSGQSGNETGGSSRIFKSETSVFAFLFFLGAVLLQL